VIAVVDYGAGNVRSVVNALASLGYDTRVTSSPQQVLAARAIVFPGVGAAADTMRSLRRLGLDDALRQVVACDYPLLAICVGLQVLFTATEEGGWSECLDIIPGLVRRLPGGLKVPHMGWNQVKQRWAHPIFHGIPDESNFYFVHSYYADPEQHGLVAGTTEYGVTMCSVLLRSRLVATQFHPEKSGQYGLRMCDNFLRLALTGVPDAFGTRAGVG
jgi:glutamine amidotransferase